MILLAVLIIPVLTLGLYFWYEKYWKLVNTLWKIPGPPHYPIVGSLIQLWLSREELFKSDRQLALQFYPIYREKVLNTAIVTLLCPEDIELVLTSTKHIQKGFSYDILHSWLGTGLLTSSGAKWHTRRKILTAAFHFSILQNFVKIFNEATLKLVEDLKGCQNEPCTDVVAPITEFTLHSIIETSMGTKLSTNDNSKNYKRAVFDFGDIMIYRIVRPWLLIDSFFRLTSVGKHFEKVINTLHEFSRRIIKEKTLNFDPNQSYTTKKRLAMLDLLLVAKNEGANIDDEGIREEVDTFIFEGHDTTATAISFALLVLANHQDVQNRIYEEIMDTIDDSNKFPTYSDLQKLNYTERCLKECLRLYPSVPFISRVASENFNTTTGYTIPKGTMVHLPIYDLHHNPELYPDPEKFDPDRFLPENVQKRHPFAYIPFSAGSRNCIGQKFAMLELKAVLCGILRQFTLEAVDKEKDIVFVSDLVLRSKNGIRVKFAPKSNDKSRN